MKLFVDANLPPRLARGLGALFDGIHEVIHIQDKFGVTNLTDEDWIRRLGQEGGWCVLSGDRRIATRKPSRQLFTANNLTGFFPQPALMESPLERKASRLLAIWPQMVNMSELVSKGCFDVGMRGDRLNPIG